MRNESTSNIYIGVWGIDKSTDGGIKWNNKTEDVEGLSLIIHPSDPHILYLGTGGNGVSRSGESRQVIRRLSSSIEATTSLRLSPGTAGSWNRSRRIRCHQHLAIWVDRISPSFPREPKCQVLHPS